jgi:hypothetical protein
MAKFYFAEVRDIMDPLRSGRVKVRKYGFENDEQNIKDDDLAWALPLHPITSAATGKVGIIPTGLIVGSRVVIAYMDNDTSEQYPIVMGSFSRGALLKE